MSSGIVLAQGTATGSTQLRISLVDGVSFIDTDGTVPVANFIGEKLEIIDSAGKKISGFVKAAGSGESLGSNKDGNWNMETDSHHTTSGWANNSATGVRSNDYAHEGTWSF